MSWFGPKLEPGERVLLRSRLPFGAIWSPGLVVLGMILLLPGFRWEAIQADPFGKARQFAVVLALAATFWLCLVLVFRSQIGSWVITDRRIGLLSAVRQRIIAAIARENIEQVKFEGSVLSVDGVTGSMRLYLGSTDLSRLRNALGQWGPSPATPAMRFTEILNPGEHQLFRYPSTGLRIAAMIYIGIGALAIASVIGFVIAKDIGFPGIFLVLGTALIGLPNAIVGYGVLSRWNTVVTDRRVMTRRPYDQEWCDISPLTQIERIDIVHGGSMLELRGSGQALGTIANTSGSAARLRDAIERAKEAAG